MSITVKTGVLDTAGFAFIVNGDGFKDNDVVYLHVIAFIGQFGVRENDHHANKVAKEECLKYPHSLLTAYFVLVR